MKFLVDQDVYSFLRGDDRFDEDRRTDQTDHASGTAVLDRKEPSGYTDIATGRGADR